MNKQKKINIEEVKFCLLGVVLVSFFCMLRYINFELVGVYFIKMIVISCINMFLKKMIFEM